MPHKNEILFYDAEDVMLPQLLHPSGPQGEPCGCRDCLGIRARILQISTLRQAADAEQPEQRAA